MDARPFARPRLWVPLLACSLAVGFSVAGPTPAAEDEPSPDAEAPAAPVLTERVRVTATRLADRREALERVPAHVTVLEREHIARSGARSLQDLLALEAGVVLYDQVGNDVEKTLDLRGFTEGSSARVFLDGAPLNDPRNDAIDLDFVPLVALERVEITRGSLGAPAGAGAEAGAIHLWTRRGAERGGSLSVGAGTHGTVRAEGVYRDAGGRLDWSVSGSSEEADGFRDNSGGDLRRLAAGVGWDLGAGRRAELSLVDGRSELGNPGALTRAELDADRTAAPFNRLDSSDERVGRATLNFRGPLTGTWSLAANAFGGLRDSAILSTGRSAATFGGFFLDAATRSRGATVQLTRAGRGEERRHELAVGTEWLDGATEAQGFFTPPEDPARVEPAGRASDNTSDRRTLAMFVQQTWRPRPDWTIVAGARYDRDRVAYEERFPDPANDLARTFSELSLRAGASWSPRAGFGLYGSWGEAFRPPTVEQLFAFPLFFSNPELRPEDSRTLELGLRSRPAERWESTLALFRVNTEDEIVFVPGPNFTGRNVNAGRTRRDGLELSLRGRPVEGLSVFGSLTLLEATQREGPDRGNDVPLVPGARVGVGVLWDLGERVDLGADALWVGQQRLDGDTANAAERLDGYLVVNARAGWSPTGRQGAGPRLFVEARNLLDREYATRGILAGEAFFTPAPGRRWLAGAEWQF